MSSPGDKLSWTFALLDKISGPAKSMAKSIGSVKTAIDQASKSAKKTTPGIVRLQEAFKSPQVKAAIAGTFNWIGKTYGPKAAGFIAKSTTKLFEYNDVLKDAGISMGDLAGGAMSFLGKAGSGLVMGAAGIAVAATAMVAGAATLAGAGVMAGGKLLMSGAMFRENAIAGMSLVARSDKVGQEMFEKAMQFAEKTPLSAEVVADSYRKLLTAGFKGQEVEIVMKAVGDMSAVKGFDPQAIDTVLRQIGQIKAKGALQMDELRPMVESGGLNLGAVFDSLQKRLGKSRSEVLKMITAKQISGDVGVAAVVESVKNTLSGGKLGGATDKLSKTLSARFEQLASAPIGLAMMADTSGAFSGIGETVGKLADSLSSKGTLGKAVMGTMKLFAEAFQIKDPGGAFKLIEGALLGINNVIRNMIPGLKAFITGFGAGIAPGIKALGGLGTSAGGAKAFGVAMGYVGSVIGTTITGIIFATKAVFGFVQSVVSIVGVVSGAYASVMQFASSMYGAGVSLIQGFANGITSGVMEVYNAAKTVGQSAINAVQSTIQAHSPSRVAENLGINFGEGYYNGLDAMTGNVASAAATMVAPPSVTGRPSGGSKSQVVVTINIDGANKDGKGIAQEIESSMVAIFERMSLEAA